MKEKFFKWEKENPELSNKMLNTLEKKFAELNVEECELLVIAKVKMTDKINTTETREYDGVQYGKLFFP